MQIKEKLLNYGTDSLSDLELILTILGNNLNSGKDELIAKEILAKIETKHAPLKLQDLRPILGLGKQRLCQIFACLELGRRHSLRVTKKITSASQIFPYLIAYADKKQEHFLSITLNGANEVIEQRVVSVGLVNSTQVHPREVFADPLVDRASSIIVAHNHPSGNLEPSTQDIEVTKRLQDVAKLLGIKFLDHIIFASTGFYSFAEAGRLD